MTRFPNPEPEIMLILSIQYVYSAWAPQLAERLKLSSTESNIIGTAANLGMYASGIPIGILVDARGPRIPVMLGAITLGLGYYPIHKGMRLELHRMNPC